MAKTKHRVSARKQAERMKQAMRQARLLKVKQTGQPLIPANVLEKLAALNLPPILGFMKPV
jgi:hypothetical protein